MVSASTDIVARMEIAAIMALAAATIPVWNSTPTQTVALVVTRAPQEKDVPILSKEAGSARCAAHQGKAIATDHVCPSTPTRTVALVVTRAPQDRAAATASARP